MSLFQVFLKILPFTCRHTHTYRERRKLHGVMVMHFVCEACGHAVPAVERTAREHREAVKVGDPSKTRVLRQPGQIVPMTRSRKKPA